MINENGTGNTGKEDLAIAKFKEFDISFVRGGAYVNLNELGKPFKKRMDNWMRLKSTTALLACYPNGFHTTEGKNGGTWAIEPIAAEFKRWCQKVPVQASSHIYFIRAVGLQVFKVGVSSNPRKRLIEMQIGSPSKLALSRSIACFNAVSVEKIIHSKFAKYHSHGEWFRFNVNEALVIFDSHFE